jgi:PAS domain S-box-containing protein
LKLVYVNQGVINLFGSSQQELLQMTLMDFEQKYQTSVKSTHRLTELLSNSAQNTLTFESTHQRQDGSWTPIEIFAQYISIPGQGHRFIEIVRDITERKRAEKELQRAKEAAEAANRAKSTFLANMSHELRTPLNGILGYTQILHRDSTLTDKQREGINIIHRSGEYLLTLINDVLDLSKIEAGRIELYPTDFNFSEFINGLTELFEMRAQQKGIAFIYEPLSRLPVGLHGDEKRLRQVLINLLGNAIKFTDRGGVSLKVGYLQTGKLRFQIEDTGPGIAKTDMSKIFLPFQQVGDPNYRAEGTGLGLAITKKLTDMMGGQLDVKSQLGQGSAFGLDIDFPEVSALVVKPNLVEKPIIRGYEGLLRKLLVVDDKWENRSVMANLLKPLGFEIEESPNGRDALNKAKEWCPDLIITDLVMPAMDGFELARQLRRLPEFQQVPIIACSASVFDYHQQQSLDAGCNGFIPKPVRAEVLLETLRESLGLTWTYEQTTASDPLAKEVITEIDDTTMPLKLTPEQATILFQLAEVGDIKGILKTVDDIEQQDEHLKPLTSKIAQLANSFEDEQICEMMREFL